MDKIDKDILLKKYGFIPINLSFSKELEKEYQGWVFQSSIKLVRITLLILIGLYIVGSLLDSLTDTSTIEIHFYILLVLIPIFTSIYFFTFNKFYEKIHQIILSITYILSALALIIMKIYKPENYIYTLGLMMVFSAGHFLFNMRFLYSAISSLISLFLLNILTFLFSNISPYDIVAYNFFYSGVIFINIIASYSIELYQRKNYILNKKLQKDKDELKEDVLKTYAELSETETKLSILFDNTFDGIYILDNKKYEYVNNSFCQITGYSFDELTSPNFDFNVLLTSNSKSFMEERYRLRQEGKEVPNRYEIEIKSKDDKEKHLEVTTVSIGKEGHIRVFGIMRDITDRIKHEQILIEQNELRKILVEISAKFINLSPGDATKEINNALEVMSNFVKADRAYIFDLNFETGISSNTYEYCQESIEPFIDELQNIKLGQDLLECFGKGEVFYVPNVSLHENNYTKKLFETQGIKSLITVPMIDNNIPIGFVGFDFVNDYHISSETESQMLTIFSHLLVNINLKLENESQLIQAKSMAEESDRLKSAFLANLSHEIRTPMNGIIGFMNLLKFPDLTNEERDEYIQLVSSSGNRLLSTLEDIIEISHIDSGMIPMEIEKINLSEELIKIADNYEQKVRDHNLSYKLNIDLPDNRAYIPTDKKKLGRIMHHLIVNAIKFTNEGFVEIGAYPQGNKIIIYVKDSGIGIHDIVKDKVFERFVQADLSISRSHEGSGLGLSIVNEYVKLLNYKISLESEVDKGTLFTIEI